MALGYVAPDAEVEPVVLDVPDVPAEQVAPDVPDAKVKQVELLLLHKIVIYTRGMTGIIGKKMHLLLSILMGLPAKDGFVVLGKSNPLSKSSFLLGPQLIEIYHELCMLLIRTGFMLEVYHEEASDGKISSVSFEALKSAVCKHDAQSEYKLISDISKEANEALLAEIEARLSALN
jgi:hypothetical protein